MDSKLLGEKISALRKARGMTQKQLAERIHVTDGAVSKWERGLNYPDLSIMDSLAKALDTNMWNLLDLEHADRIEIAETLSDISVDEKKHLISELRQRCILNIVIGCMLYISLFLAGYIFHRHGIYGAAQVVTIGMLGFTSTLTGSELFFLKSLKKL